MYLLKKYKKKKNVLQAYMGYMGAKLINICLK